MKVLLVGNIANNSYNNAKFLHRRKIQADVLCYNFTHVMAQPEWEDADFEGEVNPYFPDWTQVNLNGFERPQWFIQEVLVPPILSPVRLGVVSASLKNIFRFIFPPFVKKIVKKILIYIHPLYLKTGLDKKIPEGIKIRLKPIIYQGELPLIEGLQQTVDPSKKQLDPPLLKDMDKVIDIEKLLEEFKEYFPSRKDQLTPEDIMSYYSSLPWFRRIFKKYDLIHACATDPIFAMLATPEIPFIAFEHGTLRDLPFENSPQGRLLALAFKKASRVIITNPDTIDSAKKLGMKNYLFIPHPLDQTKYQPIPTTLGEELKKKHKVQHLLLSPARHDWDVKGNDLILKGVADYIKGSNKKVLLICTLWGMDLNKSKQLIKKLGIKKSVLWIPILNESKHIKYMNSSDIILDQMLLPSFGGVAFKGMSCGKPVLSSYCHKNNQWCLPEAPPLVSAYTAKELSLRIKELLDNPDLKGRVGHQGRDWILKHHSWQLVADKLINTYYEVLNR